MSLFSAWLESIRPKTLLVAIAVILLGQALAFHDDPVHFNVFIAVLCFVCCMSLQIAVNLANDYFDDKNGIDNAARLGPVRGIQQGSLSAQQVFYGIMFTCLLATMTGLYLIILGGWLYVLLGLLSLAGVYLYSGGPKPIASIGLGELAVFVYFGWLAVLGSYYLQTQVFKPAVLIAATEIGFLVAAIMLVNNIRDIESDSAAGKFTLATRLGVLASKRLYCVLIILPSLLLAIDTNQGVEMLIILPVQFFLCVNIFSRTGAQLNQQLGQTSACVLLWAMIYSGLLLIK